MSTLIERTSNKLVKAFLKNKIIAPLKIKLSHHYLEDLQKNWLRQTNLEFFVRVKLKNL